MSRTIPAAVDTSLDDRYMIPVFFAELDLDTSPAYLHTDVGDITVLSKTWLGTGGLGSISAVEETRESVAPGVKLRLQITDEAAGSIFDDFDSQDFYQRPLALYFSTRNAVTGALLADPFEYWRGRIDVAEMVHGDGAAFVEVLGESEFASGKQASGKLFSDVQLQDDFAGDLGAEFLSDMVNRRIIWGLDRIVNIGQPTAPPQSPFPFPTNLPF